MLPGVRHAGERRGESLSPAGSACGGVAIGFGEIVGPILGQRLDQERRLGAVLDRLEAQRTVAAAIGDDQFVNGEPFGAWNLDEHAAAIGNGGGDRIGDQVV